MADAVQVQGFKVAGVHAGLKADGALDMALIFSEVPCVAAGVFTINRMKAAPVLLDMEKLSRTREGYRAVIVNTRCANACTGQPGLENARRMSALTAQALGVPDESVFVMSTGVIGTQLNMEKIAHGVALCSAGLGNDWEAAARGIMTTDTRPKYAAVEVQLSGGVCRIAGIAKGAGMIAPNMATMLAVVVTDARLTSEQCGQQLAAAANQSFNRIVIDGDMSTNDTLLLMANGSSGVGLQDSADEAAFEEALNTVCKALAQAIVRDGEGVTRFVTVAVSGVENDEQARLIANTIATSPLVKTAFYGGDANWGRIVAAAGRSGVEFDPETVWLAIAPGTDGALSADPLVLVEGGTPTAYDEQRATAIVNQPEFSVLLRCHRAGSPGSGDAVIWTCDLSHDYVSINGHYRT